MEEFVKQCEAWFEKSNQLGDNWTLENSSNGQGGYIQGRHNQGGYNQGNQGGWGNDQMGWNNGNFKFSVIFDF